jgi:predicted CXXCH cytochrome family protein
MKKITQKTVVLTLIAAGLLLSSFAMAAVSNVANSKHNFTASGSSPAYHDAANVQPQVCVYCHTPHNAGKTRLLWNKDNNSVTNFRLYTSSGTLTNTVKTASSLTGNSPSLLCLSCHDGKTAMNVLHASGKGADASAAGYPAGSKYAFGNLPIVMEGPLWVFGTYIPAMAIGGAVNQGGSGDNLTDDHPIGFSYTGALADNTARASNALNDLATVDVKSTSRIRFFGTSKKVECSTCHDPHVDNANNPTLSPFLVMPNTNSALCLACHNK